ncbi:hypothetical protein SCA6_016905, partial [Theobroma cacao]
TVQTSVLSSKWRYLWTHIDNLDLDADDFLDHIEKFGLRFYDLLKSDLPRVNAWIRYIMSCNVKELELILLLPNKERIPIKLPDNFSSCDSLVALYLGNDFVFDIPPTNKCFPSLKVLHVDAMRPDSKFLNKDNLVSEYRALRVMEVLNGDRNAKSPTLWENTIATLSSVLNDADDYFPAFLHLLHLQLGIDYCFGWKLLPHFLKNSPILKSLVLEKEYPMDEKDEMMQEVNFGWIPLGSVP